MTKISLTLKEAVYLKVALENPQIKEIFDNLVKNYMEISGDDENEARSIIFPEFLEVMKRLANK